MKIENNCFITMTPEWNKVFKMLLESSNNLAEKEDLINAVGCSKVPQVLMVSPRANPIKLFTAVIYGFS
jgi:hypothetical protein